MPTANSILKKYWGFDSFRSLQADIVAAVADNKDVLALLPTGGGKSVCFQVPALMREGPCLVISPLIALINDQVDHLKQKDIPAVAIHSGLSYNEVNAALQAAGNGEYKFIYLSPERLETRLFLEYLPAIQPTLIAVDEAHCISQWGYDFRPSYLRIAQLREELSAVPIIALTASATLDVQNDIREKLLFKKEQMVFQQSFHRSNIAYHVLHPESKQFELLQLLKKHVGSSLVYAKSRKQTEEIAQLLRMHGFSADHYHAGLKKEDRQKRQDEWIKGAITTMVCTNAFGMGIDKPDVRLVVHVHLPESMEHYYQEAGRAGRDGQLSYVYLLTDHKDESSLFTSNDMRYPSIEVLHHTYTALMNHLQVPAGSGEGSSYDFDIRQFASDFRLHAVQTAYVLQTLAQEGLLYMSESVTKPSQAMFTCNKAELNAAVANFPACDEMVKTLLRTYAGIFEQNTMIFENQLSRLLKATPEEVTARLQFLEKIQVLHYLPQTDQPRIILLRNRMYKDDFKFDMASIKKRKEAHLKRIHSIIEYVHNHQLCRSVFIARYFNDPTAPHCGRCNNCKHQSVEPLSAKMFTLIATTIFNHFNNTSFSQKDVEELLPDYDPIQIKQSISYLIKERKLIKREDGKWQKC